MYCYHFSCSAIFREKARKSACPFPFLRLNFPPNWKLQVLELNPLSSKILQNVDIPMRMRMKQQSLGYKIITYDAMKFLEIEP